MVIGNENCRYLSGFTGSEASLLITKDKNYFITDARYIEQARKEVVGFELICRSLNQSMFEKIAQLIKLENLTKLAFESEYLTYANYLKLREALYSKVQLIPIKEFVEKYRSVKKREELVLIKKATEIAMKAFSLCLKEIRPGVSEKEIANAFINYALQFGADRIAFEPIVASGTRSSLPHGTASNKSIEKNDLLIFDFGVVYKGYHCDCTRTLVVGKPSQKQKELFSLVLKAQQEAFAKIKPGVPAAILDKCARNVIEKAGYGAYFRHSLGHGVGLQVHEAPYINQKNKTKLQPNMVFTVEPGIYLPDFGGIRIEDLVVITKKGYKRITTLPRKLISIE